MATLKELMQSMSDSEATRKNREMSHKAFTPPNLPGRDALAQWMQGVKERTLHPLEAMAKYSQDFQNMSPVDMGMQLLGGGMAGTIGKIGKGAAKYGDWQAMSAPKKQPFASDNVEYHWSSEPDLQPGKSFSQQNRTVSTLGERGAGNDKVGSIYSTKDPQSWMDQFQMELGQDAPNAIPKYLYQVKVKNPSSEGYLGQSANLPGDVTILRKMDESGQQSLGDGQAMSVPEPFKVYHGSGENFDVFDPSKAKTADHIYTSPVAGDAGQYGKPMEFMAKPSNPIDLTADNMTREGMAKLKAAADDLGLTHENMPFDDWYQQVFEPGQMYQYYGRQNEQNQLMRELFGSGNDAVRIPDAGFGGGMSNSWVFENPKLLQRVSAKEAAKATTKTQYELAHEVAQRNAALPVSEGGLGLPVNNMPLDRAKAMGFDTPAYHGTGRQPDFDNPSGNSLPSDMRTYAETKDGIPTRSALFTSTSPDVASGYAEIRQDSHVVPLLLNQGKQAWSDAKGVNWLDYFKQKGMPEANARTARNAGYDSYKIKNVIDNARFKDAENVAHTADTIAMINPANIRSRFAAFDPARRNEADILGNIDTQLLKILGGTSAAGLLGSAGYSALQNK